MVTMDGGLMGEAFYFCIPCWRDGLHGKMSEVRYQRPPARAGRFLGKRRPR